MTTFNSSSPHQFLHSRLFDALILVVIFLGLAIAFDFALDEQLTATSISYDFLLSGLAGLVIGFRSRIEKTPAPDMRRSSELFEIVGKVIIGLLLFGVLTVLFFTTRP